jgi:hypothetical protein
LLNDEVRVSKYFKSSCSTSFCHFHSVEQRLVFSFIVGSLGELIRNTYFSLSPCGKIRTTPAPTPWILLEPSKYIVHTLDRSGGPILCNSSHSAVKSGKIYDLIAFRFLYVMSRGDNSIPHKETRPIAKGLFSILESGASLTTMIRCTAKYCHSFRTVVKILYASF